MRIVFHIFIILLLPLNLEAKDVRKRNIDYVNMFIGTAGDHGQTDPSATVPYGMIKVGPDCIPASHVGYDYRCTLISGFSINRLSGIGCTGSGGNLTIRPALPSSELHIVKQEEEAVPGYYATLLDNGIRAELTATNEIAVERFAFPSKSNHSHPFHFDFSTSFASFYDCDYWQVSPYELEGWISACNTCDRGLYKFYFYLHATERLDSCVKRNPYQFTCEVNTQNHGVEIQIAVSPISTDEARKVLKKASNTSFYEIRQSAFRLWESKLAVVDVEGGSNEDKTMFYTSLYRCFLSPFNVTSSDGLFINSQGKIEQAKGFTYYSSWSLWDTYRTKFPLLTLLDSESMSHFCQSLIKLYETGKSSWSTRHETVPTVRTEHAGILLLDAFRKGIKNVDLARCYPYMQIEAASIPLKSPDNYLEAAYDYWALAEVAAELGLKSDADTYKQKTANIWKPVWREKFKNITPERFDIMHGDGLYEGTLWQYRWAVPFDVPALCDEAGGRKKLLEQLEYFFEHELYNIGNQPDIHTPYIFNHLGRPDLTRRWVNKLLTEPLNHWYGTHTKWKKPYHGKTFQPIPEAYIPEMDDDDGTMAAWYAFSTLGLYPLIPGVASYELLPPLFTSVVFHLPNNKCFTITRPINLDLEKPVKVSLNGEAFSEITNIAHKTIANGGTLIFSN